MNAFACPSSYSAQAFGLPVVVARRRRTALTRCPKKSASSVQTGQFSMSDTATMGQSGKLRLAGGNASSHGACSTPALANKAGKYFLASAKQTSGVKNRVELAYFWMVFRTFLPSTARIRILASRTILVTARHEFY